MTTKTEAKHTPGPWQLGLTASNGKKVYSFAQKCTIAHIYAPFSDVAIEKANARLIAAAPELLNLLKKCLECTKANYKIHSGLEYEIEAAIAKAEGGK